MHSLASDERVQTLVQTTKQYIEGKQELQDAVNDRLGISVTADNA
jgi:hypothetical protein